MTQKMPGMTILKKILTVLFFVLITIFGLSSILTGRYLQVLPLLIAVSTFLLPVKKFLSNKIEAYSSRTHILLLLFLGVSYFAAGRIYLRTDIFRSAKYQKESDRIYNELEAEWPQGTKSRIIKNSYGDVHILETGPDTATTLFLIPAGNMGAVFWGENIKILSSNFHCYAVDPIGEAGKSRLKDLKLYPRTEQEEAAFYIEVMDSLGLAKASLVAAGEGGRSALILASYRPERISGISLIAPLGITKPSPEYLSRTIITAMFPMSFIRQSMEEWIFGVNSQAPEKYRIWYDQVLKGTVPHTAYPIKLTEERLKNVQAPVFLILGDNDNVCGPPEKILKNAATIPRMKSVVLETPHLAALEKPDEIACSVIEFLQKQ